MSTVEKASPFRHLWVALRNNCCLKNNTLTHSFFFSFIYCETKEERGVQPQMTLLQSSPLDCFSLSKVKNFKTADLMLSRKPWNMKHRSKKKLYSLRGRIRRMMLIETNKQKKEKTHLSFNSAELKIHLLSYWQADRVRTPTEQQSTAWLSCWWCGAFQVALFHNATLCNIKNSKGNETEQG